MLNPCTLYFRKTIFTIVSFKCLSYTFCSSWSIANHLIYSVFDSFILNFIVNFSLNRINISKYSHNHKAANKTFWVFFQYERYERLSGKKWEGHVTVQFQQEAHGLQWSPESHSKNLQRFACLWCSKYIVLALRSHLLSRPALSWTWSNYLSVGS